MRIHPAAGVFAAGTVVLTSLIPLSRRIPRGAGAVLVAVHVVFMAAGHLGL